MNRKTWIYIVFFALLFAGFYIFLFANIDMNKSRLPVISQTLPFRFERQDGRFVTEKEVRDKVFVAEFFFTTCTGICPKMNRNMQELYRQFSAEPDFLILSHTVDPTNDSAGRMKRYADSLGADSRNWWFLTGTKDSLYSAARKSYMVDDPANYVGNAGEEFLHTQFFALVDRNGRVRGIYDGLKREELKKLSGHITELLKENY